MLSLLSKCPKDRGCSKEHQMALAESKNLFSAALSTLLYGSKALKIREECVGQVTLVLPLAFFGAGAASSSMATFCGFSWQAVTNHY